RHRAAAYEQSTGQLFGVRLLFRGRGFRRGRVGGCWPGGDRQLCRQDQAASCLGGWPVARKTAEKAVVKHRVQVRPVPLIELVKQLVRWSISTGLTKKASKPAAWASRRYFSPAKPVTATSRMWSMDLSCRTRVASSTPVNPGRSSSSTTTSGIQFLHSSKACGPS